MTFLYARAIAAVAVVALAGAGAGRCLAPVWGRERSGLEQVVFTMLGGLGVLGTLLFVVGQFYFTRGLLAAVLVPAAALGIAPAKEFVARGWHFCREHAGAKGAAGVIALVLLITAVAGLAEVRGDWENDAVAYHLLGPRVWLRDAVIRPVPDNCHTAFPQTAEVLFAALLSIGGDRAPGVFAVLPLGLFLLAVAALARRAGLGGYGAWWCMALVVSMPAVYAGARTGFIDVWYASLVMAAVILLLDLRWPADFAALGLFCGLAMGTKYTGLLVAPALALTSAYLWKKSGHRNGREFLAHWMLAGGVACLVASPFYLRNWILLGSPIYPTPEALLRFFHPKYLPVAAIREFQEYMWHRGAGLGRGPLAYLALPFHLTYQTSRFHGAGGIGLAPLAFAPMLLLFGAREKSTKALALLAWVMTSLWFLQQESRFLIPVYGIAAVLAVLGWRAMLARTGRMAAAMALAVVAISLSYGCFMIASARSEELHRVVSPSYAERVRAQQIPYLASFQYLNETAAVRKVLILDRSVPPYYLERDYLKPIGQWDEQVLPGVTRAVDALPRAQELGVTHVLDVQSTIAPFQVPPNFPGLELVVDLPEQRVYRVL